jgi:phospholipase C
MRMPVFDIGLLVAVPANKWIGEWVRRGSHPSYRGELASQLRLIRKRHGTPYAREWVRRIDWIGSYPLK